ncbi:uncharacterized protein AB675_137 [Cyphellophora attinorum]|uniref:V-SNARE coiled-coil homology domain-containing protein n=1 Tax=Cyphellophora attinorum TaxID=1664694 RepID=A0A0N0NK70_9EURO|nr:uncharacterized protein AB675_137 [Phialophora attinorum]KPI37801.1 hypothetical protein AB675_137 [Phialophora attinorum]
MSNEQPYDPYIPLEAREALLAVRIRAISGRRLFKLLSSSFRRGANRVRKQMWWKDMKMRMCLIVGIIILLVVIIVPAVVATTK